MIVGAPGPTAPPLAARFLALFLLIWEPLGFAFAAASALDRLMAYGAPALLLLAFRVGVTALGIVAGRALWAGRYGAPALGQWWALLHAAAVSLTFHTPYFPGNRPPSLKRVTLAAIVAWDVAWAAYLRWSPRVAAAYEQQDEPGQDPCSRCHNTEPPRHPGLPGGSPR